MSSSSCRWRDGSGGSATVDGTVTAIDTAMPPLRLQLPPLLPPRHRAVTSIATRWSIYRLTTASGQHADRDWDLEHKVTVDDTLTAIRGWTAGARSSGLKRLVHVPTHNVHADIVDCRYRWRKRGLSWQDRHSAGNQYDYHHSKGRHDGASRQSLPNGTAQVSVAQRATGILTRSAVRRRCW